MEKHPSPAFFGRLLAGIAHAKFYFRGAETLVLDGVVTEYGRVRLYRSHLDMRNGGTRQLREAWVVVGALPVPTRVALADIAASQRALEEQYGCAVLGNIPASHTDRDAVLRYVRRWREIRETILARAPEPPDEGLLTRLPPERQERMRETARQRYEEQRAHLQAQCNIVDAALREFVS